MTWLVFGGTSGIGREVVSEAASKGVAVRAFARSAEEGQFEDGVEAFKGDALKADDVAAALEGASVVVQSLGVKERPAMVWEEEHLFSQATAILLPLMQEVGVRRLITVTGYGTGESMQTMSLPARMAQKAVLGKVYEDKTRQEDLIKATDLDWTLVRPTLLTNNTASKQYNVLIDPSSWHMGMVSRADVAHFVVGAGLDNSHLHEAVVLA